MLREKGKWNNIKYSDKTTEGIKRVEEKRKRARATNRK